MLEASWQRWPTPVPLTASSARGGQPAGIVTAAADSSTVAAGPGGDGTQAADRTSPILQPWSSAPLTRSKAISPTSPTSTAATARRSSGGGVAALSPPWGAALLAAPSSGGALLSWFAVVVELLGDVVRLALHEAWLSMQQLGSPNLPDGGVSNTSGGGRVGGSNSRASGSGCYNPVAMLPELQLAELALALLGDALSSQAMALTDSHRGGGYSAHPPAVAVDLPATLAAVTAQVVRPSPDVDRLFTHLLLDSTHTLTGVLLCLRVHACMQECMSKP